MERHTRSFETDKKTRKARKRTLTGGSTSENTGSRTSSAASSRERSASTSSRLSNKSGASSVKSVHKSSTASGKNYNPSIRYLYNYNCRYSITKLKLKLH